MSKLLIRYGTLENSQRRLIPSSTSVSRRHSITRTAPGRAHQLLFSLEPASRRCSTIGYSPPSPYNHERLTYRAMKAALANEQPIAVSAEKATFWPGVLVLGSLVLIWGEVVRHLGSEWSYNPQYSYGWSVPFLVVYILWRRWPSRPAPEPVSDGVRRASALFLVAATFLLLALRFLAEANPDWRFLSWTFALTAAAMTLVTFYFCGGKAWARYFAFPILFFLVAVPWPTGLEQAITQNLMRAVTAINVFGLNVAGIPALQRGNVIEVAS